MSAAAPGQPPPKSPRGPLKRLLAVHLTLTIGILLGMRHEPEALTVAGSAPVELLGPNYASFAGPGGASIAVAVGGRRWYGPQSALIEGAPVTFLGDAEHLCELPEGMQSSSAVRTRAADACVELGASPPPARTHTCMLTHPTAAPTHPQLNGTVVVVDLIKAPCQADVVYRNLDSNGAAALVNLAPFPGAGMLTFAYSEKVPEPEGRMLWLDIPRRSLIVPDGRLAQDFFPASIESGDLAVATVKLSDPLDNPFVRSFVHPLWSLWLRCFVPLLAFATFCDALAVVVQERWRRAYIVEQRRSDEPALIGWTVRSVGSSVVIRSYLVVVVE